MTLSTLYLPPKSHLEEGHITGSQTLNKILQSLALMKSVQSPSTLSNDIPVSKLCPLIIALF